MVPQRFALSTRVRQLAVVFVSLCASARAEAASNFTVNAPALNAIVADSVTIAVAATGSIELRSVRAAVGGASVNLTATANNWTGQLLLTGEARGSKTVEITATDALGAVTQETVQISVDRPPTITLTAPLDNEAANSKVTAAATCADDDPSGCARIRVLIDGEEVLSQSGGLLKAPVSLAAFDGRKVALVVEGVDSVGQAGRQTVSTYVINAPRLTSVARATNATILDFDGGRLLTYGTGLGTSAAGPSTLAMEKVGSAPSVIFSSEAPFTLSAASLTRNGAIFQIGSNTYESGGGMATPLAVTDFRVNGDYTAWVIAGPTNATYSVRNDVTGHVDQGTLAGQHVTMALGANGDLALELGSSYQVQHFRDGEFGFVASPGRSVGLYNDGVNVAYFLSSLGAHTNEVVVVNTGEAT